MKFNNLRDFMNYVNSPENMAQTRDAVGAAAGAVEVVREVVNNVLDDTSTFIFKVQEGLEQKSHEATEATVRNESPDWSRITDVMSAWTRDSMEKFANGGHARPSETMGEGEHDENLDVSPPVDNEPVDESPVDVKPSNLEDKIDYIMKYGHAHAWNNERHKAMFSENPVLNDKMRAVLRQMPYLVDTLVDELWNRQQ